MFPVQCGLSNWGGNLGCFGAYDGGRFQQGSVRAFELQQETWRLSWASVFCQVKGCAFSGIHLFQALSRSYFLLVLNLDNGHSMP